MKIWQWDTNLKVRIFGETINSILFWMFFPFMTLYFVDQFGEKMAGILMMGPALIGIFSNLYGGYAADRFGRKKMMVISLAVEGLLLLTFAFSPTPWIDYLAFLGLAMMGSIYHPASMAMVADIVPVEERRPVFAAFYTSINIGVVLGPILGSFFFFNYKRYLILTSAMVTITLFFIMVKVIRETLPASAKKLAKESSAFSQLSNYLVIFRDKAFFFYILAGILVSQAFMQMDLYIGVYIKQFVPDQIWNLRLFGFELFNFKVTDELLFGWIISENGLLVVVFTVIVTRMIQAWSDERALIVSSILFGLSLWLMAFSTNALFIIFLMGLFTLAELIRTPVIQNFITRIAPEDKRGQYLGASSLQFSVGRFIAPLAVFLAGYFPPIVIFSLIFVSTLLSAVMYRLMFKIIAKREMNESQN